MNQKDLRVRKLHEKGMRDKARIARAIGYGGALEAGIRRVEEAFQRLGIEEGKPEQKTL